MREVVGILAGLGDGTGVLGGVGALLGTYLASFIVLEMLTARLV